jgi:hypothetical protein
MDACANALIGGAAAQIAAHCVVDIAVTGLGIFCQQRDSGHDLAGLTIPALRNIKISPDFLNRFSDFIAGNAFNGGYGGPFDIAKKSLAGSHRDTIQMHGTGTTLRQTTAKFCTCQPNMIPQGPQ